MRKQLLPLLVMMIFLVSAVGCSSSRDTGSSRYPSTPRTSKNERTSYPGIYFPGERSSTRGLPPGQAKKKHGDQSAKAYAPGQRKKNHSHGPGKGNGNGKKGKKH